MYEDDEDLKLQRRDVVPLVLLATALGLLIYLAYFW
jgi:hypothetical protein